MIVELAEYLFLRMSLRPIEDQFTAQDLRSLNALYTQIKHLGLEDYLAEGFERLGIEPPITDECSVSDLKRVVHDTLRDNYYRMSPRLLAVLHAEASIH
ncbi:MAG: hypothetical protein ACXAE3_12970 [Candidatus Kariarchaeaceae archaeon]